MGVGGAQGGRLYPLIHNTILLGRGDDADILIPDPSVSARHARLINGSQGFEVEDLGSTNGTFVGGRRVVRTRLRSGDRIVFGQVEFKFLLDRRIDATMTVIPPGIPTGARRSALVLQELPRPRETAPRRLPFGPSDRDEDDGPSLEEFAARAAKAYKFVRQHLVLIGRLAGIGALLGLVSMTVFPAPGEAVCVLKLQPQVKTNPVDAQWNNRVPGEEQEVRFFASAETAFVQPELVAGTLRKMLAAPPSDATVSSTAERLRIEAGPDHSYKASYRDRAIGGGPVKPTDFLSAHIENYLHGEISRAIRVFTAQVDFLREQFKTVTAEMKTISDEKMQFSQKNADRLPEDAAPMLGSRYQLETHRADLMAQVRKLQGELDAQRHALNAEGPLSQNKFHASQVYRDSLATLNRKLTEAYARGLAEGHPEVRQINDEKQRIEELIQQEMVSPTTPLDRESNAGYQELRTRVSLLQGQLSAAKADLADTEKNLARIQSAVGDLPRVQAGVQQLTHMQNATTQLHGQLFEQLKKAELQLNLERVSAESRYEVVSPPHLLPADRVKTGLIRLALGVLFGLIVAAAVMAIKEFRPVFSRALSSLEPPESPSGR